jgi:hypothetical protein
MGIRRIVARGRRLGFLAALPAAIGLAGPAWAAPALAEPLKPCYATAGTADDPEVEAVMVHATGFTPNAQVDLSIDGEVVPGGKNLQTDSTGALGSTAPLEVPAPYVRRGEREFALALNEVGNPANALTAASKTAALSVSVRPRSAPPSSRVRFSGSGFTGEGPVYAHYIRYRKNPFTVAGVRGKFVRTVRMKQPTGDCGSFTARRRQIPVREARTGYWLIRFDQSERYARTERSALLLIRVHWQ